jgi:hypothetical protein
LFDAKRPILLNGIEELATRSDLLERAIVLNLPTIPEDRRRTETRFWREFETSRPLILGALLSAVSGALHDYDSIRLDRLPRMADFAQWATAAETYLGLTKRAFMAAYTGNREAANDLALEASPVAAAIIAFVEREESWTGSATELLKELNALAGDEAQRQQGWPKRGNVLSGALKRLASNLRATGINFSRMRSAGQKGSRLIQLEKICNQSSEPSDCQNMPETLVNPLHSSDDPFTSDDPYADQLSASSEEKHNENGLSDGLTISDDVLQTYSNSLSEYELDEEELRFELEERAAIMSESEAA